MEFLKYQHLERLGTTEVRGIEEGMCYIFPKIDGTNASLWFNGGKLNAGSRRRHLTLDADNAGFLVSTSSETKYFDFFGKYPGTRLYGEWLVPHTLKTYSEESWRQFYIFDVMVDDKYLDYETYKPMLEEFSIEFIPPICKVKNPTDERIYNQLEKNTYLIKDGSGVGEGIVIKNYDFVNKYGNTVWAKVVNNDFKVKHQKVFDVTEIQERSTTEEEIIAKYVTLILIDKELAKIEVESGWSSKLIPKLLGVVFYSLVKEESWNFVKEFKNPVIDFKRLQAKTIIKIKELKPQLF